MTSQVRARGDVTAGDLSGIRGLLFDKDGTLIDFDRTWGPINRDVARAAAGEDEAACSRLLAACGYDEASGVTRPGSIFAVAGLDETLDFIRAELGGKVPSDLKMRVERLYSEGGGRHAVLIEGVAAAITTLHAAGFVLGVATNDTAAGLEASLGRCNLLEPFVFRAGCDSGFGAKPEPGMIHAFARATGLALDQIAMIGDSGHDMETGRNAGVHRIAVLTGTGTRAELEPLADVVIAHVRDLIPRLAVPERGEGRH